MLVFCQSGAISVTTQSWVSRNYSTYCASENPKMLYSKKALRKMAARSAAKFLLCKHCRMADRNHRASDYYMNCSDRGVASIGFLVHALFRYEHASVPIFLKNFIIFNIKEAQTGLKQRDSPSSA